MKHNFGYPLAVNTFLNNCPKLSLQFIWGYYWLDVWGMKKTTLVKVLWQYIRENNIKYIDILKLNYLPEWEY